MLDSVQGVHQPGTHKASYNSGAHAALDSVRADQYALSVVSFVALAFATGGHKVGACCAALCAGCSSVSSGSLTARFC